MFGKKSASKTKKATKNCGSSSRNVEASSESKTSSGKTEKCCK